MNINRGTGFCKAVYSIILIGTIIFSVVGVICFLSMPRIRLLAPPYSLLLFLTHSHSISRFAQQINGQAMAAATPR